MDKTINERFVKFPGHIPFAEEINLGEDIVISIKGHDYIFNCVKRETFDNQDGTVDRVFVLKTTLQ